MPGVRGGGGIRRGELAVFMTESSVGERWLKLGGIYQLAVSRAKGGVYPFRRRQNPAPARGRGQGRGGKMPHRRAGPVKFLRGKGD